jgi:threonine/homoserine/homoserine lactone efflux protein
MGASAKFTSGEVTSRALSSTAVLITGYRNEFTRGVLTALGSLVVVGILALLVAFGVSVLF